MPRSRRRDGLALCLAVPLAYLGMMSGSPAGVSARTLQEPAPIVQRVASQYLQLTSDIVHGYASSSARYYARGVWENGDPSCWYCNIGPAVGAAFLSRTDPSMLPIAVTSLNSAIATHSQANGSLSTGVGAAIPSASFGSFLGLAYVRLAPRLDTATRTLWTQTLTGIADYLISDQDVTWYANGNINASYATELYFAWRTSGAQKYLDAYNAELQFLVAPPAPKWSGSGLVITQQPTQTDGRDGRGFLTEGSPAGWDPEYTQLQLDFLSVLYSASGDERVLRLLNLLVNQELTRISTSTFILDAHGGSRKSETMPFTSAALALLVVTGNRPDLAPLLPAAFTRLSSEYYATLTYTQHNFYRGLGTWLAPILLATSNVPPLAPSRRSMSVLSPNDPVPVVSPHVLNTTRLVPVLTLEVPKLEYAFAAPATLARGISVAARSAARLSLAAIGCVLRCTLTVRPLLVIHRSGKHSQVTIQKDLAASGVTLRAQQLVVARVAVPGLALDAARRGCAVFVRLRLTVLSAGNPLQGRSAMFRISWRG